GLLVEDRQTAGSTRLLRHFLKQAVAGSFAAEYRQKRADFQRRSSVFLLSSNEGDCAVITKLQGRTAQEPRTPRVALGAFGLRSVRTKFSLRSQGIAASRAVP